MSTMAEVTEELLRISEESGGVDKLLPETVVREAENPASPLHSRFEWNDTEAGHKYRLIQARHLISVAIVYLPREERTVRAFVSLTTDRYRKDEEGNRGGYREIVKVLQDPDHTAQMLDDARRAMNAFRRKYAGLADLAEVFAAIDHTEEVLSTRAYVESTAQDEAV